MPELAPVKSFVNLFAPSLPSSLPPSLPPPQVAVSIGDIRSVESGKEGLDVDSAFQVSLLFEGEGGDGLQWRPVGGGAKVSRRRGEE